MVRSRSRSSQVLRPHHLSSGRGSNFLPTSCLPSSPCSTHSLPSSQSSRLPRSCHFPTENPSTWAALIDHRARHIWLPPAFPPHLPPSLPHDHLPVPRLLPLLSPLSPSSPTIPVPCLLEPSWSPGLGRGLPRSFLLAHQSHLSPALTSSGLVPWPVSPHLSPAPPPVSL